MKRAVYDSVLGKVARGLQEHGGTTPEKSAQDLCSAAAVKVDRNVEQRRHLPAPPPFVMPEIERVETELPEDLSEAIMDRDFSERKTQVGGGYRDTRFSRAFWDEHRAMLKAAQS